MTMAQGGLFNGDEGTNELFTTASNGQSQSKEAKYHRAYRSDPKNKDRINSQKKRRRALKKESELGRVSSMFESAAHPVKAEQQTIEKALNKSDKPSLPNSGLQENRVCNDPTQIEILRQLSEIKGELLRHRNEIHSFAKPATPPLPINYEVEQQASVSGIASANNDNLAKNKTIAKRIIEKLPTFGQSLLIIAFLGFNTFFLVSEQASLYESMSYSSGMALLIAILSEAALILLSAMASWTSNLEWKLGLTAGMIVMVAVMVGILDSSTKNRSNTAVRQTQEAKNITKEIKALRSLRKPILARIANLDPQHYRTEISRLSDQLTTAPNGYSYKIELLSSKLATISTAEADTSKLVWQRRASLFINLLFSAFLGFLWSKNQESVLTKIGRSLSGYWQRTCEA